MKKLIPILLLIAFPVYGAEYNVASSGGDYTNITGAMAVVVPGDKVHLNRGDVFREKATIPCSNLTIDAYGTGVNPIINGADLMTIWDQYLATNIYSASCNWTARLCIEDGTILDFITWDTDIATTATGMSAGTWTLDTVNDLIYAWASDDADPDTHTMEVSIRDHCVSSDGFDNISVSNVTLKYANVHNAHFLDIDTLDVDNIICYGAYDAGIRVGDATGLNPKPSYNIIIHDNNVTYAGYISSGASAICTTNIHTGNIYNNYVGNISKREGINCGGGSTNVLIHNNEITGVMLSPSIYLDAGNGNASGHRIYDNYIHDGTHHGISIATENAAYNISDIDVYNNIIVNQTFGIVRSSNAAGGCDDIGIFHNTIVNTTSFCIAIGGAATNVTTTNLVVKNNIMQSNGTACLVMAHQGSNTWTIDNNDFYYPVGITVRDIRSGSTIDYSTLAAYQSTTGQDLHSITSDPMIEATPATVGMIATNSPCIDAGTDVGIDEDYRGVSRESQYDGDLPDIGAYERKAKQPTYTGQTHSEWQELIRNYRGE